MLRKTFAAIALAALLSPPGVSASPLPELLRAPAVLNRGPVVDPSTTTTEPVVTLIGDSISVLWGPHLEEEIEGIAAVHNTAWSGHTAEAWYNAENTIPYPDPFWQLGWQGAFGPFAPAPDICTIGFATNEIVAELVALVLEFGITEETLIPKATLLDPSHPRSLESQLETQRTIAEDCLARGAQVVLLRPIGAVNGWIRSDSNIVVWMGFEFRRMDKLIKQLARDLDVDLVKTQVGARRYWQGSDGFHPNAAGRAVIAKRVAKKVRALLKR